MILDVHERVKTVTVNDKTNDKNLRAEHATDASLERISDKISEKLNKNS